MYILQLNNLITNGGFENPNVRNRPNKFEIRGNIEGWQTQNGEIGWGKLYNQRWS